MSDPQQPTLATIKGMPSTLDGTASDYQAPSAAPSPAPSSSTGPGWFAALKDKLKGDAGAIEKGASALPGKVWGAISGTPGAIVNDINNAADRLRYGVGQLTGSTDLMPYSMTTAARAPVSPPGVPQPSRMSKQEYDRRKKMYEGVQAIRQNEMSPTNPQGIPKMIRDLKAAAAEGSPPMAQVGAIETSAGASTTPTIGGVPREGIATEIAQNPEMATLPSPISASSVPEADVATPHLQDQLKRLAATPLTSYGMPGGFLGGLGSLIQSIGAGLGGNPEQSLAYQALRKKQEAAQNLISHATAYKYNAALNQMNQDFQARYQALEGFPAQQAMLVQGYYNDVGKMIPQVWANSKAIPFLLENLSSMGGPGQYLAQAVLSRYMGSNTITPSPGVAGATGQAPGAGG